MIRGFGWLPRYDDTDRRALHSHRTLHRVAVLWRARANDDEARRDRDVERLLDGVDVAIRAGMKEAPEQRMLRESGEWAALAAPEYWTDWRREYAA